MKRIVFLMITLLLMSGVVMAQKSRCCDKKTDPKERAEKMTGRMVKEFSLDEAQKQKLLKLNLSQVEQMEAKVAMHQDEKDVMKMQEMSKEDRQKMREKMKASREAYDAQLKNILTKEQYDSYLKKQAERNQKVRDGRKRK